MSASAYGTTQIESRRGTLAIERLPVAASQNLKVGNLVYLASGLVTAFAGGTTIDTTTNSSAGILGIMAEDSASQAVNTLVSVIPFDDDTILTARSNSATPSLSKVGALCQILVVTTTLEIQFVTETATNGIARLIAPEMTDARSAPGTKEKFLATLPANCRWRGRIIQTSRNLG